jgi:hypothetical protein
MCKNRSKSLKIGDLIFRKNPPHIAVALGKEGLIFHLSYSRSGTCIDSLINPRDRYMRSFLARLIDNPVFLLHSIGAIALNWLTFFARYHNST